MISGMRPFCKAKGPNKPCRYQLTRSARIMCDWVVVVQYFSQWTDYPATKLTKELRDAPKWSSVSWSVSHETINFSEPCWAIRNIIRTIYHMNQISYCHGTPWTLGHQSQYQWWLIPLVFQEAPMLRTHWYTWGTHSSVQWIQSLYPRGIKSFKNEKVVHWEAVPTSFQTIRHSCAGMFRWWGLRTRNIQLKFGLVGLQHVWARIFTFTCVCMFLTWLAPNLFLPFCCFYGFVPTSCLFYWISPTVYFTTNSVPPFWVGFVTTFVPTSISTQSFCDIHWNDISLQNTKGQL